jgi:hypothetical protein
MRNLRLLAETREFWQDGVRETAETSFANPLQNAEMPKLPKLFQHHMSYDIHIISASYDISIDNQIFLKKISPFFILLETTPGLDFELEQTGKKVACFSF